MAKSLSMPAMMDRDEFLRWRWRYHPGEHVTLIGPTGCGKTWLAYQLLARSATVRLPAMVLVMKPVDPVVSQFTRDIGFRRVASWPPPPNPLRPRPMGWTIWPRHRFDPAIDDPHLFDVFRAALLDGYKRGRRIIYADETIGLARELRLDAELSTLWMRGRSMGTGLWAAAQRPAFMPLHGYSQASHLFLAYDPDKRSRERFAEIGGIDPDLIQYAAQRLLKYHFLYIRRDGSRFGIITP